MVLILIVLPFSCKNKVFSPLNTILTEENKVLEDYKNKYRKSFAIEYLKGLNMTSSKKFHLSNLFSSDLEHLIIVIVNLPKHYSNDHTNKYSLTQLVTHIDAEIRGEKNTASAMLICNRSVATFQETEFLSKFYPTFIPREQNSQFHGKLTPEEIQKRHFTNCIQMALHEMKLQPNYLTLIRDSVVPYANFLSTLHQILRVKMERIIVRGEPIYLERSWLFLQLQEPVVFRSFALNWVSFRELLLVAAGGGILFHACGRTFRITSNAYPRKNGPNLSVRFSVFGAILCVTLALLVGRPYLIELRRVLPCLYNVYPQPGPVYLSGVTLPREGASIMVNYLSKITCSNYMTFSHVWDQAINSMEKPGYIVSPSLLRYVADT